MMSKLRELGITSYSARAFLSILESQPVSATTLCRRTGIPDSKIYYALKELEEKNLIIVQRGTPSLYRALSIDQIASNLQDQIDEEHVKRSAKVKDLARLLEPLHVEGSNEDVELAYIIRGARNIIEKMKDTIDESKEEVIVMINNRYLLDGIAASLKKARSRGSRLKIALADSVLEEASRSRLPANKTLCGACNMLIVDSEKLIAISGEAPTTFRAIVTQDDSMIYMCKQTYENPACCTGPKEADVKIKSNL